MVPFLVAVMFTEPEIRDLGARRFHHNYRALPPLDRLAPAFSAKDTNGGQISVPSIAKGKKATVITFWFYDCNVCRVELPKLQKIYAALKGHGLGLVAVNVGDSLDTVQKYWREAGYAYPAILDTSDIASVYGVSSFPTTIVLDSNGKVADRFVGLQEKSFARSLARLGLQVPFD